MCAHATGTARPWTGQLMDALHITFGNTILFIIFFSSPSSRELLQPAFSQQLPLIPKDEGEAPYLPFSEDWQEDGVCKQEGFSYRLGC